MSLQSRNDALRDDVAAGRIGCVKAVCQSVREATTTSAWIITASPDWRACEQDYFT